MRQTRKLYLTVNNILFHILITCSYFIIHSKDTHCSVNLFFQLCTVPHNSKMYIFSYFSTSEIEMHLNIDGILKSQLTRQWTWYGCHCTLWTCHSFSYCHTWNGLYALFAFYVFKLLFKMSKMITIIYHWIINYYACRKAWKESHLIYNRDWWENKSKCYFKNLPVQF